jgi:hypothetical protein
LTVPEIEGTPCEWSFSCSRYDPLADMECIYYLGDHQLLSMEMIVVILVIVTAAVWYRPYGGKKSVGHPVHYGFSDLNPTHVMDISILLVCSIFSE